MAGLNSRSNFDKCYINSDISQSVKSGNYKLLEDSALNEKEINYIDGPRSNIIGKAPEINKGETSESRANIENILKGLDDKNSKCNISNLNEINNKFSKIHKKLNDSNISNDLNTINSRMEIFNDKERSTLHLKDSFPIINPQDEVYYGHNSTILRNPENSRFGKNTRLEVKDTYSNKLYSNNNVKINEIKNDIFCDYC